MYKIFETVYAASECWKLICKVGKKRINISFVIRCKRRTSIWVLKSTHRPREFIWRPVQSLKSHPLSSHTRHSIYCAKYGTCDWDLRD